MVSRLLKLAFFRTILLAVSLISASVFPQAAYAIDGPDAHAVTYDTTYYEDCGSSDETAGEALKKQVYVLGDSLTSGMVTEGLEKSFALAGWANKVNARGGRALSAPEAADDGLREIDKDATYIKDSGTAVIALGTNTLEADFAARVTEAANKLKTHNPSLNIYWVDMATTDTDRLAVYSTRNSEVYTAGSQSGFKVIPWYRTVFPNGNPLNMQPGESPLMPPGEVHPTKEGYAKMRDLVANSVINQSADTKTGSVEEDDCVCGATASATSLPDSVPEPYRSLFPKAAQKFNADLILVTVVFYKEHGGSFPPPPPPYGSGKPWASSPAGAKGPFQFLDGTWAAHGQDGNGDGKKDVQDLADASYGAAEFLASMGGTHGTPLGSPANPYAEGTLIRVAAAYNFGPGNIEAKKPLPKETQSYVQVVYDKYKELAGGSNTASVSGENTGCGGLGIAPDGFVFPIKTSKEVIKAGNGQGLKWCYTSQKSCHHSYPAADIAAPTSKPVVAARGGTVTKPKNGGSLGDRMSIIGEDGKWYYYAHMLANSLKVKDGDKVTAGQVIGEVGTAADAEGTSPHVHFDVSDGPNHFRRGYGYCNDPCTLIDPQPVLIQAYSGLPETGQ